MTKKVLPPQKLTKDESNVIGNYFFLHDFEFELFLTNCIEISKVHIRWDKDLSVNALVYGVMAQYKKTGKSCISNFFIKYGHRLYQTCSMTDATDIIKILKKEFKYDEYLEKVWKTKERQLTRTKREKLLK